jgi:hypothetical protein
VLRRQAAVDPEVIDVLERIPIGGNKGVPGEDEDIISRGRGVDKPGAGVFAAGEEIKAAAILSR